MLAERAPFTNNILQDISVRWTIKLVWWMNESALDQVCYVHWHLIYLCVVERLNVLQHALVVAGDEVDCYSFAAESATTTDPVC